MDDVGFDDLEQISITNKNDDTVLALLFLDDGELTMIIDDEVNVELIKKPAM